MKETIVRKTIELEARVEKLADLIESVEADLERAGCPPEKRAAAAICAEEIFVNIASYAYEGTPGTARISEEIGKQYITLCFQDRGKPYNPLGREEPDITLSAQEREVGGLGVFMVKKMMDTVAYEYRDGWNRLTMTLFW